MIALDLGTRSIDCVEFDGRAILHVAVREHKGRAMTEGGVYDLDAAAEGVREVRTELGLPVGTPAAVAVAGGRLRTLKHAVALSGPGPWNETDLAEAEKTLLDKSPRGKEPQVLLGVTRSNCRRDGRPVRALVGMEGDAASYDCLATFLPMEHVRSKISAIELGGFAPTLITAEPLAIAAALFSGELPPALFAIIDIGAGTSDIALVSPNGLAGVMSVPSAGDAITDAIASAMGLSYADADALKRSSGHTVTDLWGSKQSFDAESIRRSAEAGVDSLVSAIAKAAKKLLADAGEPLAGAVLVGGGSLWPDLPARLATALALPQDRVRVRAAETLAGIEDRSGLCRGASLVTVAGIVLSAPTAFRVHRFSLNGRRHLTLEHPRADASFTVAQALVAAGEDPLDYFGAPGAAHVDGDRIIGGEPGGDPVVTIDGRASSLDTAIAASASITISQGAKGRAAVFATSPAETPTRAPSAPAPPAVAAPSVAPVEEDTDPRGFVTLDGQRVYCGTRFRLEPGTDGASTPVENIPPLLSALVTLPHRRSIRVNLNGEWLTLRDRTMTAAVNGRRAKADSRVAWDAVISTGRGPWRVYEALHDSASSVRLSINGCAASYTSEIADNDRITAE